MGTDGAQSFANALNGPPPLGNDGAWTGNAVCSLIAPPACPGRITNVHDDIGERLKRGLLGGMIGKRQLPFRNRAGVFKRQVALVLKNSG